MKKNYNLTKISTSTNNELQKELKLINDKYDKLYNEYTSKKTVLFNALKDDTLDKENLLTIINDIETSYLNDFQYNNRKLIEDINKQQAFDKVDLLLITNINQQLANIIYELKSLVFVDWKKESNRTLIAKLIISYSAMLEAISSAAHLKDAKYSWSKYIGGLYSFKYLRTRLVELIKNPNFKYTHFNEWKENKKTKPKLLYSDKELLKKQIVKNEFDNNSNL